MAFRGAQIWISSSTRARLKLVAEMFPYQSKDLNTPNHTATLDEVADQLLQDVITQQFPAVVELEKELDAVKKRYRSEAKKSAELPVS